MEYRKLECRKPPCRKPKHKKKDEKDVGDPNPAYEDCLLALKRRLEQADAVVIGAGSGLSAAAGLTYAGRRFEDHFKEFIERYGMRDMYSAGVLSVSHPGGEVGLLEPPYLL